MSFAIMRSAFIRYIEPKKAQKQKCQRNAEQAATRITEDRGLPGALPDSAVALG